MSLLSSDQVRAFVAVVDNGSFSAAAKMLHRTQSAVSYAIGNLERQLGVELFDRSTQRPTLSPAGAALLNDARRSTSALDVMRDRGRALAKGIEAELDIAADIFCPLDLLGEALADFAASFPMVRPKLHVELVHKALALVLDGICPIGIVAHPLSSREGLEQAPVPGKIVLRPYVSPRHPLASSGRLENADLEQHVQFVLGDRDGLSAGQEFGIFTHRTWQTSHLDAQQALMRAGIGWGFLPMHAAERDVADGLLLPLELAVWPEGGAATVSMMAIRRTDSLLGPAANWFLRRILDAD